jgi:lysozyme
VAAVKTSAQGIAEILSHEAIVTAPYRDSVGVWTIGVGHTSGAGEPNPNKLARGVDIGVAECIRIFKNDLPKYEAGVNAAVKVPVSQYEYDAMVSFHFNTGAIGRASFVKLLNQGKRAEAVKAIMQWTKPPEITGRRTKEMVLFRDGKYSHDGRVTIYPASVSGAVQWNKGKRVSVAALIEAAPFVQPKPAPKPVETVQAPAPAPSPAPVQSGWLASLLSSIAKLFKGK